MSSGRGLKPRDDVHEKWHESWPVKAALPLKQGPSFMRKENSPWIARAMGHLLET